ncbi:hypothetical protein BAE27_07280 [Acidithiobacillus caldus]|uniref:Uncharacterized protein n=1 Tax=Acidithiobacillus caldus TaxID=33059 RepID=A0A1E7YN63_9PROT|nr:hypothetical protein BAE27_07280 [Acidithiobacillus caldus]
MGMETGIYDGIGYSIGSFRIHLGILETHLDIGIKIHGSLQPWAQFTDCFCRRQKPFGVFLR